MPQSRVEKPSKTCGCTGVRWCAACTDPELRRAYKMDPALELPPLIAEAPRANSSHVFEFDPTPQSAPGCPDFRGLRILPDFLSPEEAEDLLAQINESPFALAQSGKQKQHYGAKVNFNKQRVNASAFAGLPAYLAPLEARLISRFSALPGPSKEAGEEVKRALSTFRTTDLFVLRYQRRNASNLDLHLDDTFAYGEAIIDISLESDSVMTFTRETTATDSETSLECVRAKLAAGSAALLTGPARFDWEHGILFYDIVGQRTSITLRTLSDSLRGTKEGRRVLAIAQSMTA